MNTVQKNNNITRKQVQELLEENQEKLGLSDKNLKKMIKSMRSHTISRQMRKVFYQECLKKIERNEEEQEGKFKHLTPEDRISIEILHTAGFNNSFIGTFVGKDRSSIKREIDINSTKSTYKEKKQINIKYYSSEKAQKNAEENKLKNRKKCKLDRYTNLKWAVVALLKEKNIDYSPDVIANLSKEGNTNAGKYVATYLVEDLFDLDLKGNRCYGYSNNLNKPIEIKNDTKRNIEDITKEYKDYDLTFSNCYQIRFVDKTGKERTSNVNYYDFYKKEN